MIYYRVIWSFLIKRTQAGYKNQGVTNWLGVASEGSGYANSPRMGPNKKALHLFVVRIATLS